VQENSQDHVDFLLSKIRVRYDEIEAEQQRLAVRVLLLSRAACCLLFLWSFGIAGCRGNASDLTCFQLLLQSKVAAV
jgi:hypothetical protein